MSSPDGDGDGVRSSLQLCANNVIQGNSKTNILGRQKAEAVASNWYSASR